MDEQPLAHEAPVWTRVEVVWPLAIFAGFAGTWTGLAAGSGWLATLGALALYAPIHVELGRRNGTGLAVATGVGWGLGIAGAILGGNLEARAGEVLTRMPLAGLFEKDLLSPDLLDGLALVILPSIVCALTAAPTRGALGLALVALGLGGLSTALSPAVVQASAGGVHPMLAVLAAWPPHHAAWIVAAILWGAAAGAEDETPTVRSVRAGAWTLAVSALLARLALGATWSAWSSSTLGTG